MLIETFLELFNEYKYSGAYDLSDRFTVFTMVLLLVGTATTSYKFYVNSPLTCFTAVNPTGENFNGYATNYIWTHGSLPSALLEGSQITELPQWNALLDKSGVHYYQWIPLILLAQFLLLFFCRHFWESACSTNASHNLNTFLSECKNISATDDTDTIIQLASKLRTVINKNSSSRKNWIQKKFECFGFSRRLGNWISSRYMAFKIVTILVCVAQVYIIVFIFDIYPSDLMALWSDYDKSTNTKFPVSVVGFVPNVAVLGSFNSYSVNCVMTVNLINEKLFVLLQSIFIVLAAINSYSLILWLINVAMQNSRRNFIKKYLPKSTTNMSSGRIDKFIDTNLRWDGLFVLRMIKKTRSNHLVSCIVKELWAQFLVDQPEYE